MTTRLIAGSLIVLLTGGCMSANTRERPFTEDWAESVRGGGHADRRSGAPVEEDQKVRRVGPATVTHDETGRPEVKIGGVKGLGADIHIRSGVSTRIRYNYEWDFVKPQRRR